jgi:hypothetical protein
MPIKKIKNFVQFFSNEEDFVLNYFTFNKKAHFRSESKLYEAICVAVNSISPYPIVHLTTYPYIAVHIRHGEPVLLNSNKDRFSKAIEKALELEIVN